MYVIVFRSLFVFGACFFGVSVRFSSTRRDRYFACFLWTARSAWVAHPLAPGGVAGLGRRRLVAQLCSLGGFGRAPFASCWLSVPLVSPAALLAVGLFPFFSACSRRTCRPFASFTCAIAWLLFRSLLATSSVSVLSLSAGPWQLLRPALRCCPCPLPVVCSVSCVPPTTVFPSHALLRVPLAFRSGCSSCGCPHHPPLVLRFAAARFLLAPAAGVCVLSRDRRASLNVYPYAASAFPARLACTPRLLGLRLAPLAVLPARPSTLPSVVHAPGLSPASPGRLPTPLLALLSCPLTDPLAPSTRPLRRSPCDFVPLIHPWLPPSSTTGNLTVVLRCSLLTRPLSPRVSPRLCLWAHFHGTGSHSCAPFSFTSARPFSVPPVSLFFFHHLPLLPRLPLPSVEARLHTASTVSCYRHLLRPCTSIIYVMASGPPLLIALHQMPDPLHAGPHMGCFQPQVRSGIAWCTAGRLVARVDIVCCPSIAFIRPLIVLPPSHDFCPVASFTVLARRSSPRFATLPLAQHVVAFLAFSPLTLALTTPPCDFHLCSYDSIVLASPHTWVGIGRIIQKLFHWLKEWSPQSQYACGK